MQQKEAGKSRNPNRDTAGTSNMAIARARVRVRVRVRARDIGNILHF